MEKLEDEDRLVNGYYDQRLEEKTETQSSTPCYQRIVGGHRCKLAKGAKGQVNKNTGARIHNGKEFLVYYCNGDDGKWVSA